MSPSKEYNPAEWAKELVAIGVVIIGIAIAMKWGAWAVVMYIGTLVFICGFLGL